jgi:thymidylate synthase (FAD)
MKITKPSYQIVTNLNPEDVLFQIECAARTCYKSEGKVEAEFDENGKIKKAISARKLIKTVLLSKGHEAMLEFGGMIVVKFTCDRGVSHELVRHRIASFAQESTRYCNYSSEKFGAEINVVDMESHFKNPETIEIWLNAMQYAEASYNKMIELGETAQIARSVLPNSTKTEINVGANIREWRHFFKLRCAAAAHPQMRELAIPLLEDFKTILPELFDDITY